MFLTKSWKVEKHGGWSDRPDCCWSLLSSSCIVSMASSESDQSVWWLMKMSWRKLWLWPDFVPPAFMCLGAIIDFCVEPRRACPTSWNSLSLALFLSISLSLSNTQTHTHSQACCSINETWIRHEERPPSYTLIQGLPLPSCFLSADYPAFTGLWLSGARKRFSPLSRSTHTHAQTYSMNTHTPSLLPGSIERYLFYCVIDC